MEPEERWGMWTGRWELTPKTSVSSKVGSKVNNLGTRVDRGFEDSAPK